MSENTIKTLHEEIIAKPQAEQDAVSSTEHKTGPLDVEKAISDLIFSIESMEKGNGFKVLRKDITTYETRAYFPDGHGGKYYLNGDGTTQHLIQKQPGRLGIVKGKPYETQTIPVEEFLTAYKEELERQAQLAEEGKARLSKLKTALSSVFSTE